MIFRSLRLLLLLLGLGAGPVLAQPARDTTVVLPEVRVEGERAAASAWASGRLTVLDAEALAAAQARTVAEVLEARTSLFVQRYGSSGLATLSLRGTGSAHTLILLDGLRISDPQTGQVDLSLLPTVLLESVEVFHGPASALYGSDGLGGVVRLGTLQADAPARVKGTSRVGAYGERALGAVATGRSGRLSGVLSVEGSRAEGDFRYVNETVFPAQAVRRAGADLALLTLFGRAGYEQGRHRISVAGWVNRAERGLPGPGNTAPGAARQWDRHTRLWATHEARFARATLDVKAGVQQTWLRYANPAAAADDTTRTEAAELDVRTRVVASPRWLAEGGLTLGHDRADLREGVRQTRGALFVQATGQRGRWLLYPALRLDAYRTEGATTLAVSPRLGVNGQPLRWPGLRLKASVSRAFRTPTFNERFWQPGGNPDLAAERGWSADAGMVVQLGQGAARLEAEVTGFATWLRDQIVWQPAFVDPAVQVWRPTNLSRVVTRGLELSLRGQTRLADAAPLDGGVILTVTDARDRSDPAAASYGQPLRYVPPAQLKLHLSTGWHALRLDAGARLIGRRYLTTDASQHLPAYRVVDAQLRYRHAFGPATATLALGVENVFDSAYTIVRLYPMPPRHVRVRLTIDLHP